MTEDNRPPAEDATVAFGATGAQSAASDAVPGHRIIGRLGEGGMGTVYLAEDVTLGRRVAIKMISPRVARDPAIRGRFLREGRLLATIEHPNVVRVYTFGASEEHAWLVMEYVEGETLADRIRRGPMPEQEAINILTKVIVALAAAWEKKIIHRDIKPSNILFDRRGDLKVADFGLAKGIGPEKTDASFTQAGYILGSPHYIAPEQAEGRDADFRADVYSLGVTLFEMLTGRKPFEGNSAVEVIARHLKEDLPAIGTLRSDVASDVAALVVWMTAKNPEQRPSSYAELLDAVEALGSAGASLSSSRSTTPSSDGGRWARVAAMICLAATIALFVAFRWHAEHQPLAAPRDDRLVVAVAPFWGPDPLSASEGRTMAALVQQAISTRLGRAARVIGIDETKTAVRDIDSARELGERVNATVVVWGQAFAVNNEREIQPSITIVPAKRVALANLRTATASLREGRTLSDDLPSTPEALRVQAAAANQIELRKTSAEGIGDLVTFVAAMYALTQNDPQRALELLAQTRKTPDALYQKAVCLAQMKRDEDAARELQEALKLDPMHAPSFGMLADISARAFRFPEAAAHLREAAATGRRFTTSEGTLYKGTLYVKENWPGENGPEEAATMLAIDPITDRVFDRWELPGPPRVFEVTAAGMTVKCDLGPPRNGELMTLQFVNDRFESPPLPHPRTAARIRRMRPGWFHAQNFRRDLGAPGLKLPVARFRYSDIDSNPLAPKTLPELKAALEKAIARDPTQPWYRLSLALTVWELGDRAGANRIIDEMFAQPNRGTPHYEFAWMIRQMEPLGHRHWADRAYAEALKRRNKERQPVAMTATIERMVDTPFVRRAAAVSAVAPDPPRDHLWLVRARELTGLSWDGDEVAAAAWARYLRAKGDIAGAAAEDAVRERAQTSFGGQRIALTLLDITRAAQIAIVVTLVATIALAVRRRSSIAAMGRDERAVLAALAALLILTAVARVALASRVRAIESVPVPIADDLSDPVVVSTLEQLLEERDSTDLRFITAVARHLAGDTRRAAELYRSLSSNEAAENLADLRSGPVHMPTAETFGRAFHRFSVTELRATLVHAWGRRPSPETMYRVAYEASQAFYLSLLLAGALLLLIAGARHTSAVSSTFAVVLFVLTVSFATIAFLQHRSESARVTLPVSGRYSALWPGTDLKAYPFPPDPTAHEAAARAMARWDAMGLFWISIIMAMGVAGVSGVVALAHDHQAGS